MKKSTISILLLFVMILSISVAFAADENVTSDLSESQTIDEAVEISTDDSTDSVVMDATTVDTAEPTKTVLSTKNTEILTDPGDKNFTQLQDEIDNSQYGMITLNTNYVRQDGENDIVINKNFNIFGNDEYKIDASNLGGIFKINEGCSVLLSNVILVNGNGTNGGAIYNEGTVNIISSTLTSNNASFGGALYNKGIATISGSTLDENTATTQGGAVYSTGHLVVDSSTFKNNEVTTGSTYAQTQAGTCNGGGAIYNEGDLEVTGSSFTKNTAPHDTEIFSAGGAIYNKDAGTLLVDDCTFEENSAVYGGAVMFEAFSQDTVAVRNSKFNNNEAWQGGAINGNDLVGSLIVTGSNFTGNKAVRPNSGQSTPQGGAIIVGTKSYSGIALSVDGCNFNDNIADNDGPVSTGGAISTGEQNQVTVTNSNFTNNQATVGGAIENGEGTTLTVTGSNFNDNTAAWYGGAINGGSGSTSIISDSNFTGNGDWYGAAIYGGGATITLSGNTITSDKAGIFNNGGTITSEINVVVLNNETVTTNDGTVTLNATVTDDKGNAIRDSTIEFVINGEQIAATYDAANKIFTATYTLPAPGFYTVSAVSTKGEEYTVKNGTVKNTRGTFTDLADKIDHAQDNKLDLAYDFKYTPELDDDVYVNGIVISSALTINGNNHIISGNDAVRIFLVKADLNINNVTLSDANTTGLGGAIRILQAGVTLKVNNSNFTNNVAQYGSSICDDDYPATVYVDNCIFDSNDNNAHRKIDQYSGASAIFNWGTLIVNNSVFSNNLKNFVPRGEAGEDLTHAAIWAQGTASIYNSNFTNNKGSYGGAIGSNRNAGNSLLVDNCIFINNTAYDGGAIHISKGTAADIKNSYFENNTVLGTGSPGTSSAAGGAICINDAVSANIDNCIFKANSVGDTEVSAGGAVAIGNTPSVTISDCTFENNCATDRGGAIEISGSEAANKVTVTNCNFTDNSAEFGAAICLREVNTELDVSESNFTDNGAATDYAIYNFGTLKLNQNTISNFIFNDGKITSVVKGKVLNGTTPVYAGSENVEIYAVVTDDTGINLINDPNFVFEIYDSNNQLVKTINATFNGEKYVNTTVLAKGYYTVKMTNSEYNTDIVDGTLAYIAGTYTDLQMKIDAAEGTLDLPYDFAYDADIDGDGFLNGVVINKALTINGNDHVIDGNNTAGILCVQTAYVNINDVKFRNASGNAILTMSANVSLEGNEITGDVENNGNLSLEGNEITGDVENNGNLSLEGNTISGIIYNHGNITSDVYAVVLNNKTYETADNSFKLNATLADDNGNIIYDKNLKFKVNDVVLELINYTNGIYTYDAYPIAYEPEYVINVTSAGENKLNAKIGIIKNLKSGTYTDLAAKIAALTEDNPELVLPYDFKYNEAIDGILKVININKDITIDGNGTTIDGNSVAKAFFINATVTIKNVTFVNVAEYAIYNNATLTLNNNTISTKKALIINNDTITNAVVKVLENNTVVLRYHQNTTLSATFTDDQGNLVYDKDLAFTVTGEPYPISATYNNGLYTTAPYTAREVESKVVSVINIGETPILTGLLNIGRANVVLTIVANETIDRKQLETVTINFVDEWGKLLSLDVNVAVTNSGSQVYQDTKHTDENGTITFELPSLPIGTYTITAMFLGNTNYNMGVSNAQFEVTELNFTGTFTQVQELINESEAGATIVIPNDIKYKPYVDDEYDYTNGIIINKNITIDGNGTTIDADKKYRVFTVAEGVTVTIKNLTMKNGNADIGAAILTSAKDLTLSACNFIGNDPVNGSALNIQEGNVVVNEDSLFENNTATEFGGAIYVNAGAKLTVNGAKFKNNTAKYGGAIYTEGDLTVNGATFTENGAFGGGAIAALQTAGASKVIIEDSTFTENKANIGGAVYYGNSSTVEVSGSEFTLNTAENGGAIYALNNLNVKDSNFTKNAADGGAGIFISDEFVAPELTVDNCIFTENNVTNAGGAILIDATYGNGVSYNIKDSEFTKNAAENDDANACVAGGAVYTEGAAEGAIVSSNFTGNKAQSPVFPNGGAVKVQFGGKAKIADCIFTENVAGLTGGAIDVQAKTGADCIVYVENCTFTENSAPGGGAIASLSNNGNVLIGIYDSRFIGNEASQAGAAVYLNSNTEGVIKSSNFTGNAGPMNAAIYNLGKLDLTGNDVSNIIYNGGNITSYTIVTSLDNTTYDLNKETYTLNATLTDKEGNKIYDKSLKFVVNGIPLNEAVMFDNNTGVYTAEFSVGSDRIYIIDATADKEDDLHNFVGILRNIKGTYTDLQNQIDAAEGTLELPYDFTYNAEIDGAEFPNGVVINKAITIDGKGYTISGNNSYRIFMVNNATTLNNINIVNGSAIEFGGAIYAVADLTVNNSVFDNNAVAENDANGGAIAAVAAVDDVTLTINNVDFTNNKVDNGGAAVAVAGVNGKKLTYNIYDSLFENNVAETAPDGNAAGGAIFSYGATNGLINNTVFKNNTALTGDVANGGAIKIQFGGTLTVANSTFEDNKAGLYGGAIAVQAADGIGNTLTVDNCTFIGNDAKYGDAIGSRQYYDESIVIITGSDFDEDHAVYLDEFTNTLISDSDFTGDRYPIINFGTLTLSNNSVYSIIYNGGLITTPVNSTILNNVTHDTVDDSYNLYATLRDLDGNDIYDPNFTFTVNGVTLDVVPDYDPVIGIYNVTYVFTDERVNVIDAVSPNEGILNTKYGILRNIKGTYTDLQNQIRNTTEGGTLVLPYDFTYTEEIDHEYFDVVDYVAGYFDNGVIIDTPITIEGNGYTISGNNTKRIFNVTADFELTNATLTKGNAEDGGAIYVSDKYGAVNLDVSKSTFTANIVTDAGGAIAIDATNGNGIAYNIYDSVFENNYAVALDTCVAGGAVYTEGNATGAIIGSNFTKNAAESMYRANGGAVKVQFGGDATIRDCTFTDNVAGLNGGAISIQANTGMDNKVIIDGCTFTDNGAGSAGGAISALQGVGKSEVTITDSKFTGNKVADAGGAIYFDDLSTVSVEGSNFTDNVANKGGAIYALNSLPVTGSKFKGNVAKEAGGAIYVSDKYVAMGLVAVKDSTFVENTACNAGGAIAIDATNGNKIYYLINGSEFTNNSIDCDGDCAAVAGGAVYTEGNATGAIIGSNFTENKAMAEGVPSNGGAVKVQFGGSSYIINSTFKENVAQKGAAIDLQADTGMNNMVIVSGCTFTENKATQVGGAIASLQNVGNSTLIVMNSEFKENQAELAGGAIYLDDLSLVYVNGSTFDNNGAAKGGAIYALGNLTVNASNFKANKAEDEGAAIYISNAYGAAELTVNGCNFTDNAAAKGGAVVSKDAEGVINGSYFSNNGKDLKVFNINNPGNLTVTNNVFDVSSITIKTDKDVYIYGENVNVFGDFYWGVNNPAINVTIVLTKDGSYCGNVTTELNEFQFNETLDGEGLVPGSYIATMNQFTEDAYGNVFKVPSSIGTAFVIAKANATINVTVGDNKRFDYVVDGTNVTLYLELLSNVTGKGITSNVNVVVNDTAFPVEIVNGTAVVNVTVFTPGVYAVVAEFAGNEYYNGSIYASDVFTLLNPYRTLSIDVNDTIFGVPALVTITVKDYAGNLTDGIVELAINGTAALIPVNGTLIVPITDLAIGEYLINATLMPTDLDAPIVNDTETFAVGKAPTSVEITGVWNVTYPEGVFVLYEVGNETDVTIAVSQNGTLVSPIIDSSIKGSLIIYGLSAGVYTINITNAENDNYTGSSDSALFEISKAAPVIEVSAVDVTYPDDVVVTVVSNAAGEVTVIVGGKNATETVEAGVAKNVTISGLAANEEGYGIFVELAETANYTSGVNDTEIVKVMKAASNVVIDDIADVIYHDVVEVTYTVDNKTDVTVVVKYANGTEVTTGVNTTVDGKVLISGLTAGGYTITIANAGDANHTDFTAEAKFNVLKDTVVIEPNATGDFVVDGEVNVTFTLPTDIDGIVQVTIDGQPVYAFIYDNGTYTIPGSYAAGPHTVIVTFSDDSNYENAMGQTTFDVFKVEMVMNSTIEAATAVDDTNVTVILPEDATGHVLVYVDGDLLTSAPIVNGTAQAVVSGLDAGEHTVTAVYDGDDKYTNGTYSTTFETVKAPTNTTINATVDGFNVQIEVYVNSSVVVNGGTITLTFNGENTTADVVNGVAVFKFSDLPGKTYNITAVYSGNGQFLSSNNTGSAKVLRKASYLKPVYEPFIFNYGQLYKFRLVDKEGNPIAGRTVEFSVHSKVYYVTTDSEGWGQVQLTTEMLIHADRIFSRLIFRGDGYYKPCTYAVWFNAMQEPAKFSNVKAVKPSYKVSEKNKQITATLKDSKGKPIAGKKVSLTINGKTFKIVTNSKGVVTFSLNSMKFTNPGKIPFIVVFEDVNYKRTTAQSVLTLVKD